MDLKLLIIIMVLHDSIRLVFYGVILLIVWLSEPAFFVLGHAFKSSDHLLAKLILFIRTHFGQNQG